MKGIIALPMIAWVLIAMFAFPVAYDILEEKGVIDIPENHAMTKNVERFGETIRRNFVTDKIKWDTERALERKYEYDKYRVPIPPKPGEKMPWMPIIPVEPPEDIIVEPKPGTFCTMEYAPVCCRMRTFPNQCHALANGCTKDEIELDVCESKLTPSPIIIT